MTHPLAREHAELLDLATRALYDDEKQWTDGPPVAFWVPGRVEFLGKHTDYAGGRSLLCAIDRGICVVARARRDNRVQVTDARTNQLLHTVYPATVIRRVASNFPDAQTGVDIAFASNLPMAAGMSSSSALVVSIALVLSAVKRLSEQRAYKENIKDVADLADYFGCIEGGYDFRELTGDKGVGTLSGCEDQTAMLCAKPDALVQYSFCPVRFEDTVPLPVGHSLAIGVSGVAAEKTAAALEHYNALSRSAAAVATAWRARAGTRDQTIADAIRTRGAAAVRESITQDVDGFTPQQLRRRFDHFRLESESIVPDVTEALRSGDLSDVGRLVDISQFAAETWLGNQIPETVALARGARQLGAVAASAFGAGFGGSVWALVPDSDIGFIDRWRDKYLETFPGRREQAVFFLTRAGPPATQLA